MYITAYIFLIASLLLITFMIYTLGQSRNAMRQRLQRLQYRDSAAEKARSTHDRAKQNPIIYELVDKTIEEFSNIGIEITYKEVVLLQSICYFSVFLLIFLINKNIFVSLPFGLIGFFLPHLVVNNLNQQRNKAFDKLFSDALYLIANILKSGFSLRQALQIISKEMPAPINEEFDLINQEINWGLSLNEAMLNLKKRIPNEQVSLFVTAIIIQSEAGGSLADIITKIAETIRTKAEIRGELNVLTAQGKASGMIVGLMPVVIGSLIFAVNPQYMTQLFTNVIGLALLGGALIFEVFGLIIIRSIVNVE